MKFFFEAMGVTQASKRFERMGAAAINLSPAWVDILSLFFEIETATFESQGRRGGGSWKRDSPEWLARKLRKGLDPRINHATLALRRSMTEPGAPGQVIDIQPGYLKFGSSLPEAEPSQRERPFIKITPFDRLKMRTMIADHFVRAWETAA